MANPVTALQPEKIRIIIVDDSAVVRGMWAKVFSGQPDFEIVTTGRNGNDAIDLTKKYAADVLLLDIEMPELDGISAIPLILKQNHEIRIIIASTLTTKGSAMAVKALSQGASDYIAKPSTLTQGAQLSDVSKELIEKARALGTAKKKKEFSSVAAPLVTRLSVLSKKPEILVVGSSTGGPNALTVFLQGFTPAFDLPILIVQHMPAYFMTLLAESLAKDTKRICRECVDGEFIEKNRIYMAPGDFHMVIEKQGDRPALRLTKEPAENFCRPAVDPLFRSAAATFGDRALGVVLTGLGEDGAKGSEAMVAKGARVMVQDEATSVVWGMPGAVARRGLASAILPLDQLAPHLENIVCGEGAFVERNSR